MGNIINISDLLSKLTDGGIPNVDGYISRITGGSSGNPENIYVHKHPRVNGVPETDWTLNNTAISLWQMDGTPLSGGAKPTAWSNPNNTTPGGFLQTDAVTGIKRLLTSFAAIYSRADNPNELKARYFGTLLIYDRLAHCGGLSADQTFQFVNGGGTGGITRYTNGIGNQIWLEIYNDIGTIPALALVNYKDGNGNDAQSYQTKFPNSTNNVAQRIYPIGMNPAQLSAPVTGVVSVQLNNSTGAAGEYGITIAHPLFMIPITTDFGSISMGFLDGPVPVIQPGACLAAMWLISGARPAQFDIQLTFVDNA